jgi:DNA-binding SARP family transcriptional activator
MRRVSLRLFGGFQARLEPGRPLTLPTRKAQALLAYLALRPDPAHHRDSLAALLWPDRPDEQARASLRHALYELRKALAASPAVLLAEGETVTVDPGLIDLDVAAFARLLGEDTPEALAQAVALYRGDLLAGIRVSEEPWEAWLRDVRERLREQAGDGLARLLAYQRKAE